MPSPTNGFKRENVTPPNRTRLTGSSPSLSSPSANAITTLLSNASMNASFPSTSDTNYFITPAIGRHRFSPSSSAAAAPKKSILKRSTFPLPTGKVAFESPFTTFATNALLPPIRNSTFEQQQNSSNNNNNVSRIPKPSVGFSEKNTVAIFGDTSDDNTTENESLAQSRIPIPVASSSSTTSSTNPLDRLIRQTSILYSEDEDTDDPSQPAGDSHDGTDYEEEDTATEEMENIVQEKKENGGTDDGDISYTSSTASSLVTSKWWFGKETKYVTHCDKHGCNHKHHKHQQSPPGAYLTPTQQKSKEINRLRKELKIAKSVVEEKEKHLRELRDRVKEIENMMDTTSALREHSRLMQRQKEIQDEYKAEKQQMVEKHEIRVKQLIQEAVDARAEALRKTEQLENFHKIKRQNYVDSTTNTDPPPSHAIGLQAALASLAPSPQPGDQPSSETQYQQQQQVQAAIAQDTVNQLQAYQNEALIWRTKAAQLEIVVKEQLTKASTTEAILMNDLEAARTEMDRLRDYCHRLEAAALADSICDGDRLDTAAMIRSMDSSSRATPANQLLQSPSSLHLVLAAECQSPACLERTRLLGEENKQLYESLEERAARVQELEEAVTALRQSGEDMMFEMEDLKEQQNRLAQLAEERNSECEAAQIILSRLQDEKEQLNQALLFLEERTKVYRNTILDNDLVVRDEATSEWHRGFIDPRFQILVSKPAQTDLTSDELQSNERDFINLRDKLREIQAEFSSKHKTLHEKFNEIEENLILKTNLVESLSRQLDSAQDEIQQSFEQRQKEREIYQQRINNLAKTAERIPFLETEHERMKSEKSLLERRFEEIKEEYEDGLGAALDGTLRKYKEQTLYWQDKVSKMEQSRNLAKAENEKLRKEFELLKMKNFLDKADLENRLTSSIDHVTVLHDQINIPKRDAQCDARPKQTSKYVSCKPNIKEKETQILKGELFDEIEERLKLTQVELSVTKRQLQVLQQKMLEGNNNSAGSQGGGRGSGDRDTNYQGTPRPSPFRSTASPVSGIIERNSSFMFSVFDHSNNNANIEGGRNNSITEAEDIEDLKENIAQLEERNAELSTKLRNSEAERNEQIRAEKERLQQIFNEFDNVRKELDEEIKKYEDERTKMKEKIQKLEQQKDENDKLKAKIRQWNKLHRLLAPRVSATSDSNDENEIEKAIEKMHHSMFSSKPKLEENSEEELKRSVSFPALLVTSADSDSEMEQHVLSESETKNPELNETKLLSAELARLKAKVEQSIRRTVSQNSATSGATDSLSPSTTAAGKVEASPAPAFAEFSTDLEQVQAELEKLIISMETPPAVSTVNISDNHEIKVENEILKKEFIEIKASYDEVARELDMYRNETAAAVLDRKDNPRFPRSNSSENLINTSVTPQELQRWKETAGTTFREVNRLRKNCSGLEAERRELKTQLAILKGEIELAKAQNQLNKELAEVSRRGSFQSHKSQSHKRQRKSTDRKTRTQSLSTTTGSYATANYSFASMDVLLSNSEPNIFEEWKSTEQMNSSINEKHSFETLPKVDLQDELSIVQEAFQKQVSALKAKNAELEKALASKNKLLRHQPLSRSQEAIAPVQNLNEQKEKLAMLEREVKLYEKKIRDMEDERQTMNLVMFQKGQQAAKHDLTEDKRIDELTEDRIVLKFLHDAFYYYLLNRGNTKEHLNAIMTMLNFTSAQKDEVGKRRGNSH